MLDHALLIVCERGYLESVKLLLESGADPLAYHVDCMKSACRSGIVYTMCATAKAIHFKGLYSNSTSAFPWQ